MSKTKLYLSIGWVLWLVDNGFDLVFYSIERYDGEKLTIYLLYLRETMSAAANTIDGNRGTSGRLIKVDHAGEFGAINNIFFTDYI